MPDYGRDRREPRSARKSAPRSKSGPRRRQSERMLRAGDAAQAALRVGGRGGEAQDNAL